MDHTIQYCPELLHRSIQYFLERHRQKIRQSLKLFHLLTSMIPGQIVEYSCYQYETILGQSNYVFFIARMHVQTKK
jgi:hypothetical protein